MVKRSRAGIFLGLALLALPSVAFADATSDGEAAASETEHPWCTPEVATLHVSSGGVASGGVASGGVDSASGTTPVCTYTPDKLAEGPRTLVVFLHGLTAAGSDWQYAFQKAGMRIADSKGFTVLMPRGRRGIGPKGSEDNWAWPTGSSAQLSVESDVLAEWASAQAKLEEKSGAKFDRVWVFGFSNGAYYAASLAARGRLANDGDASSPQKHVVASGYAVFAGGSGASYLSASAKNVTDRPRFFVAWGGQDPAHGDQEELAHMLHDLGWPMKSSPAPKAGHTATDKQLAEAVAFLGGETDPDKTVPKKTAAPQRDKKATKKTAKKSKSKKTKTKKKGKG
jgi:predicted esterase